MKDRKEELQEFMHREIPITRDMGITVSASNSSRVVLRAPLLRNVNHKKTAFGGSLNSLALLAGWGLLFIMLREKGKSTRIVIQDSSVSYYSSVTNDFEAICQIPDGTTVEKFQNMLERKGKSRIVLDSTIHEDGKLAVTFRGTYVVESV